MAENKPEVRIPRQESRLQHTRAKQRFGINQQGKTLSGLRAVASAEALFKARVHRFCKDPAMIAFGEENRDWRYWSISRLNRVPAIPQVLQRPHIRRR